LKEKSEMLRHFLATLAYRTQKAVRGASEGFADFEAGNQTRSPKELVRHMTSVLGYSRTFFVGGSYRPEPLESFAAEIERFHSTLDLLSKHLTDGDQLLNDLTEEQLLQGPFSDAMTHVGQLAMLRRLFGQPVPPENFIFAEIDPGRFLAGVPARLESSNSPVNIFRNLATL
jgi:hypothetical protein